MSEFGLPKTSDDAVAAACAWVAQLETGELSRADVEAFREWVNSDPQHAVEIKRLANLSGDLNMLSGMADPLRQAARHYDPVVQNSNRPRSKDKPVWHKALAVAAMVCVVFMSSYFITSRSNSDATPLVLSTPIGGYLEWDLADGSRIKLNTNTLLRVEYQDSRRDIYLLRGEAHFQVVHDSARPFVVHSGKREILAVGTAFVVRIQQKDIRVVVTEGRVAISQDAVELTVGDLLQTRVELKSDSKNIAAETSQAASSRAPILLVAGQTFQDSDRPGVTPIKTIVEAELDRQLAWQRGLFEFSETPLFEVVEEVSRFTHMSINIRDDDLRELKFDGIFPTGQPELLLDTLETSFGVQITYLDESTVVLMHKTLQKQVDNK